jgi:hypothetical protein
LEGKKKSTYRNKNVKVTEKKNDLILIMEINKLKRQ